MYKQLLTAIFAFACVGLSAQEADNNGSEQSGNETVQTNEVASTGHEKEQTGEQNSENNNAE